MPTNPVQLPGSRWLAEDIDGRGVIDSLRTTLSFDTSVAVTGDGGCNRIFGTYTRIDDKIEFGALGSTRMACPQSVMDQEQRFLRTLERARGLRLDEPTGLLYLSDADGRTILRFSRIDP